MLFVKIVIVNITFIGLLDKKIGGFNVSNLFKRGDEKYIFLVL